MSNPSYDTETYSKPHEGERSVIHKLLVKTKCRNIHSGNEYSIGAHLQIIIPFSTLFTLGD